MRRTVVLVSVVVAALVGVGGAAAIASVVTADDTGHVVDIEPLWGESPTVPSTTPSPTPDRSSSSPVSVPPHESEDVGDDHGGSSGHGGGDDDNSGHGDDDDD